MSKDTVNKENHSDEIDLLDLFRNIGKTITKWFLALGTGILGITIFLIRNFIPLMFSILFGIGISYTAKWLTKPFYLSEITFRSNTVPNSEMIAYINRLDILIREKNYAGISKSLGIPSDNESAIRKITASWVIDRNKDLIPDYVDYRDKYDVYDTLNARMQDRLVVSISLAKPELLTDIRDGLISYVYQNEAFRQKNEFRLRNTEELITRLKYDIEQLDSLQKVKYFEETRKMMPEKGGQMIFVQEQKTQLVYEDIYALYSRKQALDQEKDLYPGILTVLSDFYQPVKRHNGGLYYSIIFIPVCFGLTVAFLILMKNRRKLRDIFKKY